MQSGQTIEKAVPLSNLARTMALYRIEKVTGLETHITLNTLAAEGIETWNLPSPTPPPRLCEFHCSRIAYAYQASLFP